MDLSNLFLKSALLTQKYSRDSYELSQQILNIFNGLDPYRQRNLFDSLIVYYFELVEIVDTEVIEKIVYLEPTIKNEIMNLYDQLIEKGKIEGKIEVIINGHKNNASIEFLALITNLSINQVTQILKDAGLI